MQIAKKPIEEASDADLRAFAIDFMQLELAENATRAQTLAALSKVWKQPFINVTASDDAVQGDSPAVQPKVEAKDLTTRYQDDPVVECIIGTTSYPGGEEPASPCVNGKMLVVPRNIKVKLPYRFYDALRNSYEDVSRPGPNNTITTTRTTNFPLQEVVLPPQSEIDAWHERTKDLVLG